MKIFVWILQVLLALLYVAGAMNQLFNFPMIAGLYPIYRDTPQTFWVVYAIISLLCAAGLVLTRPFPRLTPIAAIVGAAQGVVFACLYAHFDGFVPNVAAWAVWTLIPIALAVTVAYVRLRGKAAPLPA